MDGIWRPFHFFFSVTLSTAVAGGAAADDVEQFDRIYRILHSKRTHRGKRNSKWNTINSKRVTDAPKKKKIANLSLSLSRIFSFFVPSLPVASVQCNEMGAEKSSENLTHFITLFVFQSGAYLHLPTFVSISHSKHSIQHWSGDRRGPSKKSISIRRSVAL